MQTVYEVIGVIDAHTCVIAGIFTDRIAMCDKLQEQFSKCYLKSNGKRIDIIPVSVGICMRNRFCKLYSKESGKELYRIYVITLNKVNPELHESFK